MNKAKIFVSYSRKDVAFLNEFKVQTSGLKRNDLIEEWTDQGIVAGDVWEQTLLQKLETADIIVFLVSADFIASDYIYDVEVTKAIERHNNHEVIIVPVIIRPCDFQSNPLSKFQALPKNAEPISTWENKDEAWLDVLKGIKRMIEAFSKKEQSKKKKLTNNTTAAKEETDSLKTKIAKGDIETAITALLKITKGKDNNLYNSMIMLSGRFNSYKQNIRDGLITNKEGDIKKNKIKKALLDIADELGLD